MRHVDLRVSYRDGQPRVGYLYLSQNREKSARTRRIEPGMFVDINDEGRLIGIEFLAPMSIALEQSTVC